MRPIILVLTVYFGLLSIAPNMEGIQLFKFGALIHHFQDHQISQEQFSSFSDFISSHYSSKHKTNSDERDLPFKSSTNCNHLVLYFAADTYARTLFTDDIQLSKPTFYYQSNMPSKLELAIWNPPQG